MADFLLKKNDERQCSHVDHVVHDAPQEAHFKHLRNEEPDNDEDEDAVEDVGGARLLHQLVDVVKNARHRHDVDEVDDAEVDHIYNE